MFIVYEIFYYIYVSYYYTSHKIHKDWWWGYIYIYIFYKKQYYVFVLPRQQQQQQATCMWIYFRIICLSTRISEFPFQVENSFLKHLNSMYIIYHHHHHHYLFLLLLLLRVLFIIIMDVCVSVVIYLFWSCCYDNIVQIGWMDGWSAPLILSFVSFCMFF